MLYFALIISVIFLAYFIISNLRVIFSLFLLLFIGVIPGIHALIKNWGDMVVVIENLQYTLAIAAASIKILVVRWNEADLLSVLNMMADDWLKHKTDKELNAMVECALIARVITILEYTVTGIGFIFLLILPYCGVSLRYVANATDSGKMLPIQTYYLYDKDRSPYFELTYVAQYCSLFVTAVAYSGVDNLLGVMIFHLCGQLENFKGKLTNMKQFKTFNNGLAYIVQDHIRLIKCFDIIERTFTLMLFAAVVYFAVLFCLCGFSIITMLTQEKEISVSRLIFLILVGTVLCGHMCMYCIVGEILVIHCQGIYQAIYAYKWYMLEPEQARNLILVIVRATKPLHITAGKILPMTMSTFCSIMKTSAGYISFLLAKHSQT